MHEPLRVAVFANQFPAPSETFVLNQVVGLIGQGHDVTVYSASPQPEQDLHEAMLRYGLRDSVRYGLATPTSLPGRARGALRHLVDADNAERGYLTASIPPRARGRRATSLRLLYETASTLPAAEYDVLHCHFGLMGLRALRQRSLGTISGRLVTTFHGLELSRYGHMLSGPEYQRLFAEGDLFLPISDLWRRRLVAAGCPSERTHVHHMGVSLPGRIRRQPVSPRPRSLLSVGRLTEKKGFRYAIEAVAGLVEDHPDLRYAIVGDGEDRDLLQRLIDELAVGEHIQLLGWRNSSQVSKLMQEADLLLAPSVTSETGDMEGIPVVLMEAMAIGLPVLSTYHSGIPELVEDGVNGYLVTERSSLYLVQRLKAIFDDSSRLAQVTEAARKTVERQFNIDVLNQHLEKLLMQAVRTGY